MKTAEKCPYCNNDMVLGVIHGKRDSIKWVPKSRTKHRVLVPFVKGITILKWFDSVVDGYYCSKCNKLTIDIEK